VPVTWSLDAAAGIVRMRISDPYTFDDWLDAITEIRSVPGIVFQRPLGSIIDRAEAGPPCPQFVEAVIRFFARSPYALRNRLLAFVLRDEPSAAAIWALIRTCEDLGAIAGVFGSAQEAEAWLREHLITSRREPDWGLRARA